MSPIASPRKGAKFSLDMKRALAMGKERLVAAKRQSSSSSIPDGAPSAVHLQLTVCAEVYCLCCRVFLTAYVCFQWALNSGNIVNHKPIIP